MNGALLLFVSIAFFACGYVFYGKYLKRVFGIDDSRACPSHTKHDGIDYVPTLAPVLFGHHFASIAGAGPIVGPVLAVYLGWGPAILWILLGCVFIGAMHDFAAMFLSVRNDGHSIAFVIEQELGFLGRQIFLLFCLVALILVVAIFGLQVAQGFVKTPAVATASLLFIAMAPPFGYLVGKKKLSLAVATIIFVPILFAFVWVGTLIPLDLTKCFNGNVKMAETVWIIVLMVYAAAASIIPVWILLQPRDYLNSYLLYAMMFLSVVGVFCFAPTLGAPAFADAPEGRPGIFPMLFVTIACGACSGFHALVASGTSSKQIDRETHLLPVGYGSMLVEGVLAVISVISVCYLPADKYNDMIAALAANKVPAASVFASGVAQFSTALHLPLNVGEIFVSLSISAFMLTSLDTATRLARFVWQELAIVKLPPQRDNVQVKGTSRFHDFWISPWTATLGVVLVASWLALSGNGINIWPVFGSSNQLLAALTLLVVTLWLVRTKRPHLFALLPLLFMLLISVWALVSLMVSKLKTILKCDSEHLAAVLQKDGVLCLVSFILLLLAALLVILGARKMMIRVHNNKVA